MDIAGAEVMAIQGLMNYGDDITSGVVK